MFVNDGTKFLILGAKRTSQKLHNLKSDIQMNYWQKFEPGVFYHVYNRFTGTTQPFEDPFYARRFLQKTNQFLDSYLDFYAYAIMGNHFHFIVRVREPDEGSIRKEGTRAGQKYLNGELSYSLFICAQFQRLLQGISKKYNARHRRPLATWQSRFKRVAITDIVNLLRKIAYVHHNGMHHLGQETYEVHPWTSYNSILSTQSTILRRAEVLELFRSDEEDGRVAFKNYHEAYARNFGKDNDSLEDF